MKPTISGSIIILVIILLLTTAKPVFSANAYWFQVGVFADIGTVNVTGASVQIMTHVPQPSDPNANTSFWVGLDLPNNAFIQVGYVSWASTGGYPQRFWEYYPPNTASQGGGRFHGDFEGDEVGPNGRWYTYSMQSNGNVWSFYINDVLDGSYDLGVSNSGGDTLSAVAEVEGALTTHVVLGPSEFRNFAYRDTNNVWHNVSAATGYVGLGAGSGTLPASVTNPYGLQVLGTNDWLAGSGLPQIQNGQILWPVSTQTTSIIPHSQATSVTAPKQETSTTQTSNFIYQLEQSAFTNHYVLFLWSFFWSFAIAAVIIFVIWFGPFHKRNKPAKQRVQPAETKPSKGSSRVSDKQFCLECGNQLPLGSKFCNKCGTEQRAL